MACVCMYVCGACVRQVNQQFSPQMRKWATCVRAGWSILSAILYQGSDWAVKYIRILFQVGDATLPQHIF